MNLSRPFILRPVATSLLMVAVFLSGVFAYSMLPISALPEVDYPTIQVVTLYPGASPDVITSSITAPLETQFGQMPGLNQMSSTSSGGASVITLQFTLELGLDVAEQEVQAAINAATSYLPTDLPAPPIYSKVNPADTPIVTLAVTAKGLPMPKVEDLVDTRLAQKISQISGVGLVTLSGGQRPAVRIQANTLALASYGLDLEALRNVITTANVDLAKGSFDGPMRASTVDANDQIMTADGYKEIVVAYKNGAPIRLKDVANVVDGAENEKLIAWAGTTPAILINIQRQPGANVIQVADRIKELVPKLTEGLPKALQVTMLTDRTTTIRASIADVRFELLLSIVLVVMVIFMFLRNLPATVIPSIAVPISLVGTFGIMYLAGFSINNLTLMALTIATGFVVDDAIVMIENIARFLEEGDTPMEAALKGAGQIGFTIISLTFSLIAVLIPLLFMGDVVGRLFHEFAITLAVAILISAFVSLTLTPMMCARLLKHTPEDQQGRFYHAMGEFFDKIIAYYDSALVFVLRHQRITLLVALGTMVLTVVLYVFIPKGFFPVQDTGAIQGITDASQSVSFSEMARRQTALAEVLLKDPAIDSLSSFIGVDGINATLNSGRMLINLKPLEDRPFVTTVINRLQKSVSNIQGIKLYMQPVQDLTIEDRISRTQYQFTLQDANADELYVWVKKLTSAIAELHEVADVTNDLQDQGQQVYVEIDRSTAMRLGITASAIDNVLYDAFGQRLISTMFTQSNQYRVVLEALPELQKDPSMLDHLYVATTTPQSTPVLATATTTSSAATSSVASIPTPLSTVAHFRQGKTVLAINHIGQFPAVTISFNLPPGGSLGQAVTAIRNLEKKLQLPPSIQTSFQGAALAFQASLSNTLLLILAAVITMYIVLGILYESLIHPVTILSTLPSAAIGALLALSVSHTALGIIAIIGIILLIGIVKKNAIMMIDFALEAEREGGMTPYDAIHQACLLRFRPILMTTMAALLGALPLMLGTGVGSELRHPLGITMVGGLLVSQLLTLFTTPVIYLMFDRFATRMKGKA